MAAPAVLLPQEGQHWSLVDEATAESETLRSEQQRGLAVDSLPSEGPIVIAHA